MRFKDFTRVLVACLVAALAWIVMEVGGGLFFLALGVRLWEYHVLPLWSAITSPIVWAFAGALIIPMSIGFERAVLDRVDGRQRAWVHLGFLMLTGSVLEVVFNELLFKAWVGRPLYTYLVAPTWHGSGSLLSPFYYATLMIHVPITDRVLRPTSATAASITVPA
jgi:hypothetical protein